MLRCILYIYTIHIHKNIKDVYRKINEKYIGPGSNRFKNEKKKMNQRVGLLFKDVSLSNLERHSKSR